MQTDYSHLTVTDFKKDTLNYLSFLLLQEDFDTLKQFIRNTPRKMELFHQRRWSWFKLQKLFTVKKGKRLTKANMTKGDVPFVGSIDSNNGYREYIGQQPIHKGNTITVNYNGSVAEAFYQPRPFWASDDVNVLYPKFKLNPYIALFLVTLIKLEKYRFNYGRKWHMERMKISEIKLPVTENNEPDYQFMEHYIKSLPFKKRL